MNQPALAETVEVSNQQAPNLANNSIGKRPVSVKSIVQALKQRVEAVAEQVIGREALLNQTLLALLTREHQLLFSRAGTAKSLLANTLYSQFTDAQVFKIQMTKGTPEEALVGAINIDELKKGSVVHNTKGTIVDAKLGFIDEIFDGNDVALRSLLGILNERSFTKGKQHEKSTLHMVIAATNYLRSTDVTEAVLDRFLFRSTILPDTNPYSMLQIDDAYENSGTRVETPQADRIPFEHIERLADIVEGKHSKIKIDCPAHVLFLKNNVILEYSQAINEVRLHNNRPEVYISPRTIAKSRDILNASALLDGRAKVAPKDLLALRYLIPTLGNKEEELCFDKALQKVATEIADDDRRAVDKLMDASEIAKALYDAAKAGKTPDASWIERIKLFFGWTTIGEITFNKIEEVVKKVSTRDPRVQTLQSGVLTRVANLKDKTEKKDSFTLAV